MGTGWFMRFAQSMALVIRHSCLSSACRVPCADDEELLSHGRHNGLERAFRRGPGGYCTVSSAVAGQWDTYRKRRRTPSPYAPLSLLPLKPPIRFPTLLLHFFHQHLSFPSHSCSYSFPCRFICPYAHTISSYACHMSHRFNSFDISLALEAKE